jgi:subtilase family serine protease
MKIRVPRLPKWSVVVVFCMAGLVTASSQTTIRDRITQPIDSSQIKTLQGNVHPLALPQYDQGRVSPNMKIQGVSLVFKLSASQQAALDQLLADQQDPSSTDYHNWLTPEQYAARFGMSQGDLDTVSKWLQSQGFSGIRISRAHTRMWFDGTVAQVESAFHTQIHQYRINGEMHFANATPPSLPAAFAGTVIGLRRLDTFRPKSRAHRASIAHFTSSQSGNHFLSPGDFATIYDLLPLYTAGFDGSNVTIAVMGQTFINVARANTFRSLSSLSVNPPQLFLTPNTGTAQVFDSDTDEANLDVEWAGGVAKGATILFDYAGNNPNSGVFDALVDAIDNNRAPVLSISYGNCEANFAPAASILSLRTLIQQGNSQGQTLSAASGDAGAADCESSNSTVATTGLAVDVPGAIPEVVSVGGGEFTGDPSSTTATKYWAASGGTDDISSALSYIPETAWNDTSSDGVLSAGGGGVSTLFAKPSWQTALTPADGQRDEPDVSLNASDAHDSYLVCSELDTQNLQSCTSGFRDSSGGLDAFGGTSVSAQAFAGILAILNQATNSNGLGNVNTELYSLAGTPSTYANAFHDITTGNNIVPCTAGTPSTGSAALRCPSTGTAQIGYSAKTGYDLVTGLGSVDANQLANSWPGYASTPSYSVSAVPISITAAGDPGSSTVTVSSLTGFSGTVALTCAFIPPQAAATGVSCSFDKTSVVLSNSTTSATATLTVNTTAPHVRSTTTAARHLPNRWFIATLGTSLACVFLMGIPRRRRLGAIALMLLGCSLLVLGIGCGGGSSSSGGGGGGGNTTTPTATAPTLSPATGTYTGNVTVTFSDTTPGALLYCTIDGTTPTASSSACATMNLTATTTVNAIAVANGYNNSPVSTATYTIQSGTASGAYVVQVTAKSGSTTRSANVDVTVQ